jgi:hypothetical protein
VNHFIEIRSLNLKASIRNEFHRLYIEEALPLLKRWNFGVIRRFENSGLTQPTVVPI